MLVIIRKKQKKVINQTENRPECHDAVQIDDEEDTKFDKDLQMTNSQTKLQINRLCVSLGGIVVLFESDVCYFSRCHK